GKLVLLYFAGADRHAASTVACPRLPGTALLTASLFVVLLVASTLWRGAHPAEAGSTTRFEPGTCPITPEPIPALQTAQCGFLVVPDSRSTPYARPTLCP